MASVGGNRGRRQTVARTTCSGAVTTGAGGGASRRDAAGGDTAVPSARGGSGPAAANKIAAKHQTLRKENAIQYLYLTVVYSRRGHHRLSTGAWPAPERRSSAASMPTRSACSRRR
jgi:hypothetical protein